MPRSAKLNLRSSELRRQHLDLVLKNLDNARCWEWNTILKYKQTCSEWTDEDAGTLKGALEQYQVTGVDGERNDCTKREHLEELLEGLNALQRDFGLDLSAQIERVESNAEDMDCDKDPYDDYDYRSPSAASAGFDVRDETEVRHLFMTLVDYLVRLAN